VPPRRSEATRTAIAGALVAAVYLGLAWPGAGDRGVIAEEVTPYLSHYPVVLADDGAARPLPPHDPATPPGPGWVRTAQWPNLAWRGEHRTWPVLIRGYQSALGSYVGVVLGPWLGDDLAGVRRSSVLLGLALIGLVFLLGRRLGLAPMSAAAAALACALSPGLLFFSRTGYGFELASRVAMLLALALAAPRRPPRTLAIGLCVALAVLCRATIAATLLPALALLLVHPQRWAGLRRAAGVGVLGVLAPVALLLAVSAALALPEGTGPTAKLAWERLAGRTAAAPATLAAQLEWICDPRVVLAPLIAGRPDLDAPTWPRLLGHAVLLVALARWWRGRAGDGECMFVGAALGNALFGAWLYGDPQQFQLGMALEPLFALALAQQLAALARTPASARAAGLLLALLLTARALQTLDLLRRERVTANPMLSGGAQRALTAALRARLDAGAVVLTTAYNHVGMLETWSQGQVAPVHAWRALRRADDDAPLLAAWSRILAAYPARFIVLTTGTNRFEGPYTDHAAVRRTLDLALARADRRILAAVDLPCESGDPCLRLLELSP
jgi:hypothetical protein